MIIPANFKVVIGIVLASLSISIEGQVPLPDSNDIYKGLPIVPYQNDISNHDEVIDAYNIETIIDQRTDALGFFNLMANIAEPSIISPYSSYTFNLHNYQKKVFVLDADIQTPITLGGKKWISNGNIMHTLHFIPQFKVRIFANDRNAPGSPDGNIKGDISLPVRTASYMPRITYYFTWGDIFQNFSETKQQQPRAISHFFGLSAFHHSNGQDGTEFYDDPNIRVHNANFGDINVYNGNFAEQVVFELIYGGVSDFRSARSIRPNPRDAFEKDDGFFRSVRSNFKSRDFPYNRRWYWRAALEFHFPGLTSKDFSDYDLYGRYRLNLQSGFSWIPSFRDLIKTRRNEQDCFVQTTPYQSKEAWRLVGNLQYILDPEYNDGNMISQKPVPYFDFRRLNIYASLFWRMTGSSNSALFVQAGYWGSDNYNIYFQEQIIHIKFGLAFAFFKYPKLADFEKEAVSR